MIRRTYCAIAMAAGLLLASAASQAATLSFDNASSVYSADGVTANVTWTTSSSGGSLYYNSVENAIGIGSNDLNGAAGFQKLILGFIPVFTESETITVTFDQEVTVDTIFFRQWENKVLCCGDKVTFDYAGGTSGSGSLVFEDSGLGDGPLLDPFAVGISLTSFTLTPEQDGSKENGATADTAFYLHSLNFTSSAVPVPAAAWLFGSALLGLGALSRKRKQ